MRAKLPVIREVLLAAMLMSAARFTAAGELPRIGFSLGLCCTDQSGSNCVPNEMCVVDEMCTRPPYITCAGDNGNADAIARGTSTTYPPAFSGCDESSPHVRLESSYDPATRTYTVSNVLLKWDTSSLGSAGLQVVGAQLQAVTDGRACGADMQSVSVDDKAVSAEWINWDEPVAGCDASDFDSGNGIIAISGKRIRTTGCYQVILFDLENLAGINRTGTTYLRLRVTPDTPPTGVNAFDFTAIEELYVAPTLLVTYTTAESQGATARFTAERGAK